MNSEGKMNRKVGGTNFLRKDTTNVREYHS